RSTVATISPISDVPWVAPPSASRALKLSSVGPTSVSGPDVGGVVGTVVVVAAAAVVVGPGGPGGAGSVPSRGDGTTSAGAAPALHAVATLSRPSADAPMIARRLSPPSDSRPGSSMVSTRCSPSPPDARHRQG